MLTQEQANALNLEQHALEAAELRQMDAQKEIDKYEKLLTDIRDNINSYTPEQREKIADMLPRLTEGYNSAKDKRAKAEDDYCQRINKINEYKALDAQQTALAPQQTRRRKVETPNNYFGGEWRSTLQDGTLISPDGMTIVYPDWSISIWEPGMSSINDAIGRISTPEGPRYGWGIKTVIHPSTQQEQYMTPITEWIGWISTPEGPRYSWGIKTVVQEQPQQYQTPITEWIGWGSTVNWPAYLGWVRTVKETPQVVNSGSAVRAPQLKWVDPNFVYTPWMKLRTWGNGTGTLI